jgi:hypothetical protein
MENYIPAAERRKSRIASIKNILSLTPGVGDDLVAHGAAGETANRIWVDGVDGR